MLRDGDPEQYERAAVRWMGRFALEARGVTIDALRLAADALDALPERATEAMEKAFGDEGLMIRVTGETIALSPPLIVSETEIGEIYDKLGKVLRTVN